MWPCIQFFLRVLTLFLAGQKIPTYWRSQRQRHAGCTCLLPLYMVLLSRSAVTTPSEISPYISTLYTAVTVRPVCKETWMCSMIPRKNVRCNGPARIRHLCVHYRRPFWLAKHAFVAAIVLQITRSVVHKVTCDIWQSKQEALGQTPETRR